MILAERLSLLVLTVSIIVVEVVVGGRVEKSDHFKPSVCTGSPWPERSIGVRAAVDDSPPCTSARPRAVVVTVRD